MAEGKVNVLCMKWGTRYGPGYVHALARAVARYLTRPHRFLCLTDDARGLSGIESLPLPDMPSLAGYPERGWHKLALFKPRLHDIEGQILFLDLDVVIVGALDPFFDREGLSLMRDRLNLYQRLFLKRAHSGNTSVLLFRARSQTQIWQKFTDDPESALTGFRNEQRFVTAHGRDVRWWPSLWCRSFRYGCMSAPPVCWLRTPRKPVGARIIVFHGRPNPHQLSAGGWWGQGLRRGYGVVPWVRDAWRPLSMREART